MKRVIYVPTRKTFILAGVLIFILISISAWPLVSNGFGPNWKEEMYKPGIQGKLVVIDPGHGGADPGALVEGSREADINLALARALKKELEKMGVSVLLTREETGPLVPERRMNYGEWMENLSGRKKFAIENKGHIFISLHANTHKNNKVSGGIVYYTEMNQYSYRLAEKIQRELNDVWQDDKVVREKGFSVIAFDAMPSALIEAGFITNDTDLKQLSTPEGRKKIAQAISRGLKQYCDSLPEKQN